MDPSGGQLSLFFFSLFFFLFNLVRGTILMTVDLDEMDFDRNENKRNLRMMKEFPLRDEKVFTDA